MQQRLEGGCLTAPGLGALSVFRIQGRGVGELLQRLFCPVHAGPLAPGRLSLGHLMKGDQVIDQVLVHMERHGRAAEISTHGGRAVREAVGDLLQASGVKLVVPGRLLTFFQGASRGVEVEALEGLMGAWSEKAFFFFLGVLEGGLAAEVSALRKMLLEASSISCGSLGNLGDRLLLLMGRVPFGQAFMSPPQMVLLGPPNAGKSALANALLGRQRAIVAPLPGTTRDLIACRLALNGFPFRLVDTAGIRMCFQTLEAEGIQRSLGVAEEADILLVVLDGSLRHPEALVPEYLVRDRRTILVLTKRDLGLRADPSELMTRFSRPLQAVSALTGEGLERLSAQVVFRSVFRGPSKGTEPAPFSKCQELSLRTAVEQLDRNPKRAARALGDFLHGTGEQVLPLGLGDRETSV